MGCNEIQFCAFYLIFARSGVVFRQWRWPLARVTSATLATLPGWELMQGTVNTTGQIVQDKSARATVTHPSDSILYPLFCAPAETLLSFDDYHRPFHHRPFIIFISILVAIPNESCQQDSLNIVLMLFWSAWAFLIIISTARCSLQPSSLR